MAWRGTYAERRTPHALAVDRGIQAKQVYAGFSDKYKDAPNRSDVDEYDTRGKWKEPRRKKGQPKPVAVPVERKGEEYQPKGRERDRLMRVFHRQPPMVQFRDLQSTYKVARSKKDLEKWKKDPKHGDVRGIDTAPPTLVPARIGHLKKGLGNIPVSYTGRGIRTRGVYRSPKGISPSIGDIRIQRQLKGSELGLRVESHELGHAFDRIIAGGQKKGYSGQRGFGGLGNIPMGIHRTRVEKVTRTKINPYDLKQADTRFRAYRGRREELFANWFSGYMTQRELVKKETPQFYKWFKKQPYGKRLHIGLRKSDMTVLKPYIKVPKGFRGIL